MLDPAPKPSAVFFDPSGQRAKRLQFFAILTAVFAGLLFVGFVTSLMIAPRAAGFAARHATRAVSPIVKRQHRDFANARSALFSRIAADRRSTRIVPSGVNQTQIVGAYFSPWQEAGLDSFRAHADELTALFATWIELNPDGDGIVLDSWDPARNDTTRRLVETARAHHVRIIPVLSNASGGQFDPDRVRQMLDDPQSSAKVAEAAVAFVVKNNYDGLQIDFELIDPDLTARLSKWIATLAAQLRPLGKEISLTMEADLPDASVKILSASADYAVLMAYDEHEDQSAPGPIASVGFIEKSLSRFTRLIGPDKVVLGVGSYGYDWRKGANHGETVTNQEAIALAAGYRDNEKPEDVIDFDPVHLNPTFEYSDDNDVSHEVWFLDATSVANSVTLARVHGVRGQALWALGMEDPSSWRAFGRTGSPSADLREVIFPQQAQFVGDGELLRVIKTPQPGSRSYERDLKTGLITDESYHEYPSGWLVQRSGAPDHVLALSFDDGPDPKWTPKILDILDRHHIKASFFVIGSEVAAYPELVQRIYDEGHEIGNHSFTHPNMMHASTDRIRLELIACQRAIEAVLGRSVTLFRPPFNADSEPRSYGEILPVSVANSMGYITAGETIDPLDWDTERSNPDGSTRRLTGAEIVQSVLHHLSSGNAILLHDAGGDRSATVDALEPLIVTLQAKGYRFVTMGELDGMTPNQTMPALSPSDKQLASVDQVAFTAQRLFNEIVFWGFTCAIVLGLARIALMMGLAVRRPLQPPAQNQLPRVTVLIAAYNEEPVIERTVESILASSDIDVRVVVVDDGSSDHTSAVVSRAFAHDSRVKLLHKPNGGKASALNLALAQADSDIVIGVDADTQIEPSAIAKLVRWFADPKIGAVAGNVRVGNPQGLVTRWQALEYIVSQNVDRRALARLNAITVVPGAIGAWRRAALQAAGGFRADTLAEDMDLTWRLRIAGWVIANEPDARAYTEAPHTLGALIKQRFRWTFGTLQCLWKHRRALFRYGWFGSLALPSLWLFQIMAQLLAPLVDLQLVLALVSRTSQWLSSLDHADITPGSDPVLWVIIGVYVAFAALELLAGYIAYSFEGENKRDLWLLPTQRVIYRQIMYWVAVRAVVRALNGLGQGWGKLRRSGSVSITHARKL